MTQLQLTFTVYGLPAPQGSKRHVGNGRMIESSKKVAPWREDVKLAALRALEEHPAWPCNATSLSLHATFVLPRPRAHYRTGKHLHLLRPSAPEWCSTKPDLDKLLRSTGDALTAAGAYADDSRVAVVHASKLYTYPGMETPGALLRLVAW